MFRFLDKWCYDWILHAFCINPMEGLRRARALGKPLGRHTALTPREAGAQRARHQAGWTLKALMGA